MLVAEKLYTGGFITYPRTESTRYSAAFDFVGVINALTSCFNASISQYSQMLLQTGIQKPKAGVDVGDHPPITPTNKAPNYLTKEESTLYEIISRNFLASISKDAKFFKKKVVFDASGHQFTLKGSACIEVGFLELLPWIKIHENQIPNFQNGDMMAIAHVDIHRGQTVPPDHLTESELITLMEKNGIGTDASMVRPLRPAALLPPLTAFPFATGLRAASSYA